MVTNYFHRSKKNATIGEIKQFQIFINFIRKIVNGNRAIDRKGNCRAPPNCCPGPRTEASRAGRISPSIHPSSIPCARGVEQAVPGPGWGIFGAGRPGDATRHPEPGSAEVGSNGNERTATDHGHGRPARGPWRRAAPRAPAGWRAPRAPFGVE